MRQFYTAPKATYVARSFTLAPGGLVTFSGAALYARLCSFVISGFLAFTGTANPEIKTRAQAPNGSVAFLGTITFTRQRAVVPVGFVTFSGSAAITFTSVGGANVSRLLRLLGIGT